MFDADPATDGYGEHNELHRVPASIAMLKENCSIASRMFCQAKRKRRTEDGRGRL
jgi:hypothetical protein